MKLVFKSLTGLLLAGISTTAMAQYGDWWEGTWETKHGELRLKSNGDYVYGDYANRGVIEGIASQTAQNQKYLRARFERTDGYVGYVEWMLVEPEGEGGRNRTIGRYNIKGAARPNVRDRNNRSGSEWNGTQTSTAEPTLSTYTGNGSIITFMEDHGQEAGAWLGANDIRTQTSSPWAGTWDTSFGPVRLRQAGSGGVVYGDYGNTGTIFGYSRIVDGKHILRARFDRKDGRSGYIEWASDGASDQSLEGRWGWKDQTLPKWNVASGGVWTGTRTNVAQPQLTTFSGSSLDVEGMIGNDAKYRDWRQFKAPKPKLKAVNTASAGQLNPTAATDQKHPLADNIISMADAPLSFNPRYFEVRLGDLHMGNGYVETLAGDMKTEVYGLIGIYAACHHDAGTYNLAPVGGKANKIFDYPRSSAQRVGPHSHPFKFQPKHHRRFLIDQGCLDRPGGRFVVQIQTNLKEKDTVGPTDEKWGYRAAEFFLDTDTGYQVWHKDTVNNLTHHADNHNIMQLQYIEQIRNSQARVYATAFEIRGAVHLIE